MESNIPQTVEELHTQQMNEWNGGIEKKKPCSKCKKRKEITELPPIDFTPEPLIIFDENDIVNAYHEIVRRDGIKEESKQFINDVYRQVFNEDFKFENCISCKNNQFHKLRNYIRYNLNKTI